MNVTCTIFALFLSFLSSGAEARTRAEEAPKPDDNYLGLAYRTPAAADLSRIGSYIYGEAGFHPWNGSYWPTQKGMLAHRYADPAFPQSRLWVNNYLYYRAHGPAELAARGRVNSLSPSEKYDYFIGAADWPLTEAMWRKGAQPNERWGNVPGWFGLCHGWSAAAHMRVPEPKRAVTVTAPDGTPLTFYPNDIKALASYLWASSAPASLFIGKKCREHAPETGDWGRVKDPACLDSNPMTWHLAVVNRLGRDGESLVMDSAMNNEIWNYAVDSYSLRYFNLNTMKPSRSWEDAVIDKEDVFEDPFRAHRDPATAHLVGVTMEVFFPAAIEPRPFGRVTKPIMKSKTFVYDLELDAGMNVIGGEWRSKERPDFLWTFPFGAQAGAVPMAGIAPWLPEQPLPEDLRARAIELSAWSKVAANIVNGLIERSAGPAQGGEHEEERPSQEPGGAEDPGDQPGPEVSP